MDVSSELPEKCSCRSHSPARRQDRVSFDSAPLRRLPSFSFVYPVSLRSIRNMTFVDPLTSQSLPNIILVSATPQSLCNISSTIRRLLKAFSRSSAPWKPAEYCFRYVNIATRLPVTYNLVTNSIPPRGLTNTTVFAPPSSQAAEHMYRKQSTALSSILVDQPLTRSLQHTSTLRSGRIF